jgi:hypothetical protein
VASPVARQNAADLGDVGRCENSQRPLDDLLRLSVYSRRRRLLGRGIEALAVATGQHEGDETAKTTPARERGRRGVSGNRSKKRFPILGFFSEMELALAE